MKRFLIVLAVVLVAIGILAACAPISSLEEGTREFTKSLEEKAIPLWVIIVGAVALFFIGFGLIWKLIPGFIKVIALIVLAGAVAGAAYGLWSIPAYDDAERAYKEWTSRTVIEQIDESIPL